MVDPVMVTRAGPRVRRDHAGRKLALLFVGTLAVGGLLAPPRQQRGIELGTSQTSLAASFVHLQQQQQQWEQRQQWRVRPREQRGLGQGLPTARGADCKGRPCSRRTALGSRDESAAASAAKAGGQITVLYDGLCRVCLTNKAVLESRDSEGFLRFVNIAADDYNADENAGVDFSDAMDEFHVILPGGNVLKGTEAVFTAYEAVGLGWAVGILGSDALRGFTDFAYKLLSENREAISKWVPGGDALREQIRSARFLQKGIAEGEGCNEEKKDEEDDDCTITEDKLAEDMGV